MCAINNGSREPNKLFGLERNVINIFFTYDRDWFSREFEPATQCHVFTSTARRPQTYNVLHPKEHNKNNLLKQIDKVAQIAETQ